VNAADGTLAGRTVLTCRQSGRGDELHFAIAGAGGTVVHLPLIEVTEPADGGAALRAAMNQLSRYDWLVCTSVNGVRAIARWELPAGIKLGAVGPATAEAFGETFGRAVDLVPAEHTAADLAAAFPDPPGIVLAVVADLAGDDLGSGLLAKGFEVEVVRGYGTRAPHHPVGLLRSASQADVVVLTSASAVTRLAEVLGQRLPQAAVALGEGPAQVARPLFGQVLSGPATLATPEIIELLNRTFDADGPREPS
jgi:uroporphyrinogen-III synthase